jgi:hypothetical protein
MTTRFKLRRDTEANWASTNPVLASGEPGYDTSNNRLKVGDGVSAWNSLPVLSEGSADVFSTTHTDGVNDNPWKIVNVKGTKEFTYLTPGHRQVQIPITADNAATGANSINVTLSNDDFADFQRTSDWGGNRRVYLNNTRNDNNYLNNFSIVSGTTINITWEYSLDLNQGESLTLQWYSYGTVSSYYNYDWYDGFVPDQTASATNTVILDSQWYTYWNMGQDAWDALYANPTKCGIMFYTVDGKQDDARTITSVSNNNGVYTISFDGAPIDVATPTLTTLTTNPANVQGGYEGYYLYIDRTANPDFYKCINPWWGAGPSYHYTGDTERSGYVVVNGSYTADFRFYNDETHNGLWELYIPNGIALSPTDTVEIHYYSAPTYIKLDVYRPDYENTQEGYKWFDWKDDLPAVYSVAEGNGVQGGTISCFAKVYNMTTANTYAWQMYPSVRFSTEYSWNNDYGFGYNDNTSSFGYDNNPFNYTNASGMLFNSHEGGWGDQQTLKVRIMYSMELFIAESMQTYWYDC